MTVVRGKMQQLRCAGLGPARSRKLLRGSYKECGGLKSWRWRDGANARGATGALNSRRHRFRRRRSEVYHCTVGVAEYGGALRVMPPDLLGRAGAALHAAPTPLYAHAKEAARRSSGRFCYTRTAAARVLFLHAHSSRAGALLRPPRRHHDDRRSPQPGRATRTPPPGTSQPFATRRLCARPEMVKRPGIDTSPRRWRGSRRLSGGEGDKEAEAVGGALRVLPAELVGRAGAYLHAAATLR